MTSDRATADLDDEFDVLSASRRAAALVVAARVVDAFGDAFVLVELPDSAPLAPTCVINDAASGATLVLVSSNGVATTLLVGPESELHQLPEELEGPEHDAALEAALRDALSV